jgi:hypothetical protein
MFRASRASRKRMAGGFLLACFHVGCADPLSATELAAEEPSAALLSESAPERAAAKDWHGWTTDDCDDVIELRARQGLGSEPLVVPANAETQRMVSTESSWSTDQKAFAVAFRPLIENRSVMADFALYASWAPPHEHEARRLIYDWYPGDDRPVALPNGVGFELHPAYGTLLIMHYYNVDRAATTDRSGVAMCIRYADAMRKADVTTFGAAGKAGVMIPAGARNHVVTRTCTVKSTTAGRIVWIAPALRKYGKRATLSVTYAGDGRAHTLYDSAYSFGERQTLALHPVSGLAHGDRITATCVFDNPTDRDVQVGWRSNEEICQFRTAYYPERVLECE